MGYSELFEDWAAIEEWEFQLNGALDLFVLNVRYQSAEGPHKDILYHVRDYSESMEPDTVTMIGLGDPDSTSGAGNDIRLDFVSLAILNDGGVVVAYHDSSDPIYCLRSKLKCQFTEIVSDNLAFYSSDNSYCHVQSRRARITCSPAIITTSVVFTYFA